MGGLNNQKIHIIIAESSLHCLEVVLKGLVASWRNSLVNGTSQTPFRTGAARGLSSRLPGVASQDSTLCIWSAKRVASHPAQTWLSGAEQDLYLSSPLTSFENMRKG